MFIARGGYNTRLFEQSIMYRLLSLTFHSESSDRSPSIGYQSKVRVVDRYKVIGFISSGTYGRVYKAVGRNGQTGEFAIKKFKPGE
jgi:cyclin-dependent kinase 8/11